MLNRRQFISRSAAAAISTYTIFGHSHLAAAQHVARPAIPDTLDAAQPGGIDLFIERSTLALDGRAANAITVNGQVPGPTIRMRENEVAEIRVHNRMREATSIHWHGILLPFTMDGVPGISFPGIGPGETFTYKFRLRQNGTYWYHSHSGLQEQSGLYGMLVVTPAEPDTQSYDVDYPVVLSDWSFEDPHTILRKLKTMEGYYNYQRRTIADIAASDGTSTFAQLRQLLRWQRMRMDPTDIADVTGATYTYLLNGRSAQENPTLIAQPSQRVRLRLVNASARTYFDFRIPGLPLQVIQADGQDIVPVETDELRLAVAETYDVVVTLPDDQPYTLFAETMDRSGFASGTLAAQPGAPGQLPARRRRPILTMADMGMLSHNTQQSDHQGHTEGRHARTKPDQIESRPKGSAALAIRDLPDRVTHAPSGHGPANASVPAMVYRRVREPGIGLGQDGRRVLTYAQLQCAETPVDRTAPTREIDLHLTGNMHKYIWGFDGKKWSEAQVIRFEYGERLRINLINDTMMSHPIHLHGMWMDLYTGGDYSSAPRKHTVNVQPAELLTVDVSADAPGRWAFHCHLLYHMEAGMFRTIAVVRSLQEAQHDDR